MTSVAHWLATLLAGCFILPAANGDPLTPAQRSGPPGYAHRFDWIGHTQSTLAELKVKLNLAPSQASAWDAWSTGVLKDAHEQLEARKIWMEEGAPGSKAPWAATTPERMAQGIERLRAQNEWMQAHIAQLEAALARTQTFYAVLDTNQKTIFDMFWHEVLHRVAGIPDGPDAMEGTGGSSGERFGAGR
jgi:hypothetical protein